MKRVLWIALRFAGSAPVLWSTASPKRSATPLPGMVRLVLESANPLTGECRIPEIVRRVASKNVALPGQPGVYH